MQPSISLESGDALELLDSLDANSIHAIVTDPPYNIATGENGYIGGWDDKGTSKQFQEWTEAWAEKALRVLKPGGFLLAFGSDDQHHRTTAGIEDAGFNIKTTATWHTAQSMPKGSDIGNLVERYSDVPERADELRGLKTTLKPATEFATIAQKPISESSIYKNVLKHDVGAFNVRENRIKTDGGADRYPSNVMFDEESATVLDEQSGVRESGAVPDERSGFGYQGGSDGAEVEYSRAASSGGASRFYFCSKATTDEKTHNGAVENDLKTVKPLDLMEHFVELLTLEGQTLLDPFAGSGTTLLAAYNTDRNAIGFEMEEAHLEIAEDRLAEVRTE